uniref:Protein bicaudal D n=1 Tax=Romanomermis culicivorax TaxID=13658 RepID=A0A915KKG5_ROMCU
MSAAESELDYLRKRIDALTFELDEASREKIQAAQYGLQVLEEKQAIQQKYSELETAYESTKVELEALKDALSNIHLQQKQASKHGLQHEETLIAETTAKEVKLQQQIALLEQEHRTSFQELIRTKQELEKYHSMQSEANENVETLSKQKKSMKDELRELKIREQRLMVDYSELEEENITLQKQVAALKLSQIEFESMKHDVKRLIDESMVLQAMTEEANKLKQIAEKHMEDALLSLQQEREQRLTLKKELDQLKSMDQLSHLNNLAHSFLGVPSLLDNGNDNDKMDNGHSSSEFESSDGQSEETNIGKGDLFSEVHGARLDEMECQIRELEQAKNEVDRHYKDLSKTFEDIKLILTDHADQLFSSMRQLNIIGEKDLNDCLLSKNSAQDKIIHSSTTNNAQDLDNLKFRLNFAVKKLSNVKEQIFSQLGAYTKLSAEQVEEIDNLEDDLRTLNSMTCDSQTTLVYTQDSLISLSDQLAKLYHHVCTLQGKTPDRIMLDHMKSVRSVCANNELPSREILGDVSGAESGGTDTESSRADALIVARSSTSIAALQSLSDKIVSSINQKLKSKFKEKLYNERPLFENENKDGEDMKKKSDKPVYQVLDTISDQLKFLKKAVQDAVDIGRPPPPPPSASADQANLSTSNAAEIEDLQQQNVKLRSLLSTKREQIATLRMVLKSNKQTAEAALSHLKSKYEADKTFVTDTMNKLRHEMKCLREEAATFASLRAMFAARCEEFQAKVDEYQQQLRAAEEEKKTLNSLLRMAIQQKLALTQRLEDLEVDRERHSMRRQSNGQRSSVGAGGSTQSQNAAFQQQRFAFGQQQNLVGPARVQYPQGSSRTTSQKRDY